MYHNAEHCAEKSGQIWHQVFKLTLWHVKLHICYTIRVSHLHQNPHQREPMQVRVLSKVFYTTFSKGQMYSFTCRSQLTPTRNHTCVRFVKCFTQCFKDSDVSFTSTCQKSPPREIIPVWVLTKCFTQCFKGSDVNFTSTSELIPKRNHTCVRFVKSDYTMFQRVRCSYFSFVYYRSNDDN